VRPKVREERIRNAAQGFAPGAIRENWVAADSQNLAIQSIELGALRFVGWNLFLSGGGEGERVKREDDIFSPNIIIQMDVNPRDFGFRNHGWHRKIGSRIA